MQLDFKRPIVQWVTLLFLALIWGSSFILMKRGLVFFSSVEVAAFRMSMASLVLLPIAFRNLGLLKLKFWPLLLTGLFGNAIPAFLFATAQTEIPSALAGMLNSLTSLFTLLLGLLLFKTVPKKFQVAGVLIALIGALGLIGFDNLTGFSTHGQYAMLVIVACMCYGFAVNIIKSKLHEQRPTHITALAFMLVGPICGIYLFAATDFVHTVSTNRASWMGVFYLTILAVVGTSMAVVLFNRLIKETTAIFASSVTYLIPVVAIGWGLLDGEGITWFQGMMLLVILVGIFLINRKKPLLPRKWTGA